ncbi:MAG: histidine kinase [Phycisphaerales bacterium]|nr:histidine kinase [Phycisphaerales bacterium]
MNEAIPLSEVLELERCARRDAERRLDAANADLASALAELQSAQSKLVHSDKLACIGQLAAGVAHEVNNPVGYVSSNLNTLGEYVADLLRYINACRTLVIDCANEGRTIVESARNVETLADAIDLDNVVGDIEALLAESNEGLSRVRKIVGDLRDFAHVDGPDLALHDINQLIDKAISVAWNELKYKADIVKEYADLPPVACFAGRIGQVLLNLLVNAAQAIVDRGEIRIRTGQDGHDVWVDVSDTGCGMAPSTIERIFEPFFTTKDVGQGTGLGLHMAYQIMRSHDGEIRVHSEVGMGTTFRLQWPISGPTEGNKVDDDANAR